MASVARDLGEDLTAEPLVELNVLLTYRPFQFIDKYVVLLSEMAIKAFHYLHCKCLRGFTGCTDRNILEDSY